MKKAVIIFLLFTGLGENILAQNKIIDSLLTWLKEHPKPDSQYIQTLHRVSYRLYEIDVQRSYTYYEKVFILSDSLNFTFGKSLAQINLGLLLSNASNFNASNTAYFKAVDYAEACNAQRLKAVSLNNIADNFFSLDNFGKCRKYTSEAIPINMKLKAWRGVAINYELMSRCDFNQKQYDDARSDLDKGMPYAALADESYIYSQFYLGYAKLKAIRNHTDSSRYFFDLALRQAMLQKDSRNEFQVYIAEATYLQSLTADRKLALLDSALEIARHTQYFEGIYNAADKLSKVYDELKNKDSALAYFRIYRTAFDSLYSLSRSLNVNINESEWLVRKKEIENRHLLELSQLQKKQIVFKNALLIAVISLLFLTLVTAFFINKSIQAKKNRTEFSFRQKIAESQIQSLRAQMNPHFIFNCLNSIENFMMQNEKRKASDYLHKFALLIRTILESSRDELTTVSQDMEALQLYIDLEQMRFNNKFCYRENIDPQLLKGDYNVPSLLIQPYVENAIVHGIAHSDKIDLQLTVSATLEEEYIKYVIEDNGIGRSQAASYNALNKLHHKSIGLKITEDRIHLFNQDQKFGDFIVITDLYNSDNKPEGTRVEVKVKAA
jgi:Histidine kinase